MSLCRRGKHVVSGGNTVFLSTDVTEGKFGKKLRAKWRRPRRNANIIKSLAHKEKSMCSTVEHISSLFYI